MEERYDFQGIVSELSKEINYNLEKGKDDPKKSYFSNLFREIYLRRVAPRHDKLIVKKINAKKKGA